MIVLIVGILAGYYAASEMIASTVTSTTTTTVTVTGSGSLTSTSSSSSSVSSQSTSSSNSTTASCPTLPTAGSSSLPTPPSAISEADSSLLYPLFQLWQANFTAAYPNVQLNTAAGGSGAGQSGVEKGTVTLGGSDVPATNATASQYPGILNIPMAISAQQVNYNLPGVTHQLNLTGNVLAGIYNGTIQYWDDAAIKAINPVAASQLPHQLIVPYHRSDSSGDTALFTTYLSDTSPSWAKGVGEGTTISWPSIPTAQAANGNAGMLTAVSQTQYSIAHKGISYLAKANSAGLGNAKLQNAAGNFVQITSANIEAAVNAQYSSTPANERVSLIYGPGANSYPIINYEYVWVNSKQPSAAMATDVQALLTWAVSPMHGNSAYFLNQLGFVALPPSITSLTCSQITQISS